MTPILYPSNEKQFNTNGIGILSGAVSCLVSEELNGKYELTMQYPLAGIHFKEIEKRSIIFAKPNKEDNPQPFRVYRITKPMGRTVSIYAEHISYDLSGIPVKPFTAGSAAAAMSNLETGAATDSPFTFWTDKTNAGELTVAVPTSTKAVLGGGAENILSVYGGELEYDRFVVRLHGQRGINRGVSIRYGKNLTSLEQDENISNVYTGVYPFYVDADGKITQLDELIVPAPGVYDYTRILTLDLSTEFDETPTQNQLRSATEAYIEANGVGIPKVSIKASFAQLSQAVEYKDIETLERITLGDTVNVEFPALGVSASAKCVRTIYNVLTNQYEGIELGDTRNNIADTIARQQETISAIMKERAEGGVTTAVQEAINAATALITGNKGGYVVFHSTTGGKQPDEILIMDTPDIETAVNVWRWNKSGLGHSSTGYNGPYELAITQDGAINANFMTLGGMNAARIIAGILSSADGRVQFDLTAGTLYIKNASGTTMLGFDTAGKLTVRGTIYATSGEFSGKVTATSGKIGGFTISGNNLNGNYVSLKPGVGGGRIDIGAVTLTGLSGLSVDTGVYMGGNSVVDGDLDVYDDLTANNIYSESRFYMYSPPSASSSANVRLVDQGSYYSLGLISSSKRYKKNIHDIREFDNVSERIDRVPAVTYSPRSGMEKDMNFYGFIAEDMELEFPWLVEYSKDTTGMMQAESVSYDRTPAILWADAQNTHEILRSLDERLKKLEGEN